MFPCKIAYVLFLCLTVSVSLAEGVNASILVFGLSGSGVSSTVRMMLGNFYPQEPTEINSSDSPLKSVITEYEIAVPGDTISFLKIVDIDGVVNDRLPEDDANIQASLKAYLTHPEGLNQQTPTAVLILSAIDDTRYDDDQSLYVRMLRKIIDVEKAVYTDVIPDINILLYTRLMTQVKSIQRSPKRKLGEMKAAAIKRVDGLSPNISTLVGENKGDDYGLKENENGTYRLPNREFYPKNVFDAVVDLATRNNARDEVEIIKKYVDLRFNANKEESQVEVLRVPFTVIPDSRDVDYFSRKIMRSGLGDIDDKNEVNSAIQNTYDSFLDANLKRRTAHSIPRLQAFLQSQNITEFSNLPSSGIEKVKFFQSLPIAVDEDVVIIFETALNLTMPHFTHSLTVGHGYDLLKDEVLPFSSVPFSPVTMSTWKFSGMGYLLPSFLSCDKLQQPHVERYMHTADTFSQSVFQRQSYLDYPDKNAFNISNFDGQIRLGFNIKPNNDDITTLSAVKEIRTHKMQLNDKVEFSDEFKEDVGHLSPFNSFDRDSAKEWKGFFEKWGTHVVSSGFLGGLIQGTLFSEDILEAYRTENEVTDALEQIVSFARVNMTEAETVYGVFGGDKDPRLAKVHEFSEGERNQIVDKWESSLSYEPVVLSYQLDLIPISSLIGRVKETMGPAATIALDLFLHNNLTYRRASRVRSSSTGRTGQPGLSSGPSTVATLVTTSSVFNGSTLTRSTSDYTNSSDSGTGIQVSRLFHSSPGIKQITDEEIERTLNEEREKARENEQQRAKNYSELLKSQEEKSRKRLEDQKQRDQNEMDLIRQRNNQEYSDFKAKMNEGNSCIPKSLQEKWNSANESTQIDTLMYFAVQFFQEKAKSRVQQQKLRLFLKAFLDGEEIQNVPKTSCDCCDNCSKHEIQIVNNSTS